MTTDSASPVPIPAALEPLASAAGVPPAIWARLETYLTLIAGALFLALSKGLIPEGKIHGIVEIIVTLLGGGGLGSALLTANRERAKPSPIQEAVHAAQTAELTRLHAAHAALIATIAPVTASAPAEAPTVPTVPPTAS